MPEEIKSVLGVASTSAQDDGEICVSPASLLATPLSGEQYLVGSADTRQLIEAAAANHTAWFSAKARASGGETRVTNAVTWIVSDSEITIAFPRLLPASAGTTLDAITAECFQRKVRTASCWALTPTRPRDLGARVAARGFEWGWRPHWMALDLSRLEGDATFRTFYTPHSSTDALDLRQWKDAARVPEGLHIVVDEEFAWEAANLPYFHPADNQRMRAMATEHPRRMWHFGALLDGALVGHSVLFVTTGALGVAGIYNVGVPESVRRRGIGTVVSMAACLFARDLGCGFALLNSAADGLYMSMGFESLGYGQSWWMHAATTAAPPPDAAQIAFAEAIGRGDIAALDALDPTHLPSNLNAALANGHTPMDLAVQARRPASAEWLALHGTALGILHAWDLGWKRRAAALLAASPELANSRSGNWQITPLHTAVQRGDVRLARLLLTAKPDLTITDTEFHSTPLGWANHLRQPEIAKLIVKASRKLNAE